MATVRSPPAKAWEPACPGEIQGICLFELLRATPGEGLLSAAAAVENLMLVVFTLAGIGATLAIPFLVFPVRRRDD